MKHPLMARILSIAFWQTVPFHSAFLTAMLLAPPAPLRAAEPSAGPVPDRVAAGAGLAADKKAAISVTAGGLPIILAAPHGGRAAIPGVPERKGDGVPQFISKTDANTDILTEKLAGALEQKLGKRPYVVIARFHRKYIDANRPPESAYESDLAKPAYEAYHQALAAAQKQVMERWGSGLLLDIHGQATEPTTIFRGTRNGKTTSHLIKRYGEEAQIGEKSLGGLLAGQGFHVVPPPHSHDKETLYSGGHTVQTYGSASTGTVDAIQLELGWHHRSDQALPATVEKLANAITGFARAYLPAEEKAPLPADPAKPSGQIAVGLYQDKGADPSATDLLRALQKFEQASITYLTAEQIRAGALTGLDVLIHPGGSGGGQGRNLDEPGRERIRGFVRDGGGFVGICAGAYLATSHYPWSLHILDAKVVDTQHWKRGVGTVEIELTPAGREALRAANRRFRIHYANGPLLAPANRPEIEDYEALANFKTEIATNGAPKGVMLGTTAIARGRFGQGRVICFSPHPEMTAGLEVFLKEAIEYVRTNREGK